MIYIFLSALSGALLSTAFEPIGLWWSAPLALASHMYALSRTKYTLLSTLIFAGVFNSLLLHWTSTFVGSAPWIILALGLSLFYLPLALAGRWGMSSYPLIFITLEEIRNRFPFGGFGWGRVAYSQADAPYSLIAARGGAITLSSIVLLIAAFLFYITQRSYKIFYLTPLLLLLIPNNINIIGQSSALLVQGNVPEVGLNFNSRAEEVFNYHLIETEKALVSRKDIDFILWPENSVDVDPFRNRDVYDRLNAYEQPIIVGAVIREGGKLFNTSILWSKSGQEIYIKQRLTPFGEYIPLRSVSRLVSPLADTLSDFSPGSEERIFSINGAKIAPIICFELIDDKVMHKAAINSNLLVVQTNSATFGMSAESAQQLAITRVRAIEHSRNILSASTTGYSAVIDYKGAIIEISSMARAEHIFTTVGLIEQNSIRDKVGNWASILTFTWLFILAFRGYAHKRFAYYPK